MSMLVPAGFTVGVPNCPPGLVIVAPVNVHVEPPARLRMILPAAVIVTGSLSNENWGFAFGLKVTVTVWSGIAGPG